ncbi:MAG: hypothetical protein HKM93_16470 [Desulfobacteraceae bacterium]|nr:hypothetical protein [Desulfobacteraceae bacterium]
MTDDNIKSEIDKEWESRRLCGDESCIGVIGPDGRCKECGKPDGGGGAVENESKKELLLEEEDFPEDRNAKEKDEDINWDNRILCSDDNCIGVVGPDGRCKECGQPFEE